MSRIRLGSQRGASLIELVCAVVLLSAVGLIVGLSFPTISRLNVNNLNNSMAKNLAASELEQLKQIPYALVPLTPATTIQAGVTYNKYFKTSYAGGCDCNNVSFSAYPPSLGTSITNAGGLGMTITNNEVTYQIQTCIDQVDPGAMNVAVSKSDWRSFCPGFDTGLKHVVVNVTWGNSSGTSVDSLISAVGQQSYNSNTGAPRQGNVAITLCTSSGTFAAPDSITNCSDPALDGAEVSILDGMNNIITENEGLSPPPNPLLLTAPTGTYTLHVQAKGYGLYHNTNFVVGNTTFMGVPWQVNLRPLSKFGSRATGEAFIADHPVISKVVAQVSQIYGNPNACNAGTSVNGIHCRDFTEAVEIMNPTSSPITITNQSNPLGGLYVIYCSSTACETPNLKDATTYTNGSTYSPYTIPSKSSYLIEGYDWYAGNLAQYPPPPTVPPAANFDWSRIPDIFYNVRTAGQDIIPYASGGGIQLVLNNVVVDAVSWTGDDGTSPVTPPSPGIAWTYTLPRYSVDPATCTALAGPGNNCDTLSNFGALMRANRRGEVLSSPTTFSSGGAPGANNNWGAAYDTHNNVTNFGTWAAASAPGILALPIYPEVAGALSSVTGTPASLVVSLKYPQVGGYIQICDPTSPLMTITNLWPANDPRYTSQLSVANIYGPKVSSTLDGYPFANGWPVIVVAGPYITPIPMPTTPPVSSTWTLLNLGAAVSPPGPPQPCNALPCDTDQTTVPDPVATYGLPDYGPYPDSQTPYVVLSSTADWGFVSGQILDSNTQNPISAIPVTITDPAGRYTPFEKLTDFNGKFTIIVPASGYFRVGLNSQAASGVNTQFTHYYNAHYSTASVTLSMPSGNPGTAVCIGTGCVYDLTPAVLSSEMVTGTVYGAEGTQPPLPNRTVVLSDDAGNTIGTTQTDATGAYSFTNITYTDMLDVRVEANRVEVSSPPFQQLKAASVPTNTNFWVEGAGVPVTVTDTGGPGTLVLITTYPYFSGGSPSSPPKIDQTQIGQSPTLAYSATTDWAGQATLSVASGFTYYMTCWSLRPQSGSLTFTESHSQAVSGGQPIQATDHPAISCP